MRLVCAALNSMPRVRERFDGEPPSGARRSVRAGDFHTRSPPVQVAPPWTRHDDCLDTLSSVTSVPLEFGIQRNGNET